MKLTSFFEFQTFVITFILNCIIMSLKVAKYSITILKEKMNLCFYMYPSGLRGSSGSWSPDPKPSIPSIRSEPVRSDPVRSDAIRSEPVWSDLLGASIGFSLFGWLSAKANGIVKQYLNYATDLICRNIYNKLIISLKFQSVNYYAKQYNANWNLVLLWRIDYLYLKIKDNFRKLDEILYKRAFFKITWK